MPPFTEVIFLTPPEHNKGGGFMSDITVIVVTVCSTVALGILERMLKTITDYLLHKKEKTAQRRN